MFYTSSTKPIDENLKKIVKDIEDKSTSVLVLAAHQFRYALRQNTVELTIQEPRKFNVLEEFIIRAGLELDPPPTPDELASILGLDSVFVKSTITTLKSLQTLAPKPQIIVTDEGRLFYEQGSVLQPPYSIQIYAISHPFSETITFQSESLDDSVINQPDLADFVKFNQTVTNISALELPEIQQIIQASDLALHVPTEGKLVTGFKILGSAKIIWKNISLFVIFDAIADKLSIQVRSGKQILESASSQLNLLLSQDRVSLQLLCKLSDETINNEQEIILNKRNSEIEARLEKIRQKALETNTNANKSLGTAIQLRDQQINQAFWEILKLAKSQILIYSPWVSEKVVDQEFLKLLQKLANDGVWILIGHGIAQQEEDEDRPISPEVEAKLRDIKTPNGLPAVQVFWLGNSHVKEIIVDQKIHLCGSHNWLSYRGDYLSRGESVYKVTIPDQVQEAYQFLAYRFQNQADKLWDNALQKSGIKLATQSLCIWGALGMEDYALKKIQENDQLEFFPVWLGIVNQGLRSGKIPGESPIFPVALGLLNQVSPTDIYLEALRQGWCGIIKKIARQNRHLALNLLTEEVWSDFLRLQIAKIDDSPEIFIKAGNREQGTGNRE